MLELLAKLFKNLIVTICETLLSFILGQLKLSFFNIIHSFKKMLLTLFIFLNWSFTELFPIHIKLPHILYYSRKCTKLLNLSTSYFYFHTFNIIALKILYIKLLAWSVLSVGSRQADMPHRTTVTSITTTTSTSAHADILTNLDLTSLKVWDVF